MHTHVHNRPGCACLDYVTTDYRTTKQPGSEHDPPSFDTGIPARDPDCNTDFPVRDEEIQTGMSVLQFSAIAGTTSCVTVSDVPVRAERRITVKPP